VFQRVLHTGRPEHHAAAYYQDERILGWRDNYVFRLSSGEIVAIYEDVTHQKQLEEELLRRQTFLETIVNTIPDIICLKDGEGRWLLANAFDLELFQLQGVEYKGKTDAELGPHSPFYQEAFSGCMATDAAAWAKGRPSRVEEVIPRPDGSACIFDIVKIPLFGPDGDRQALVVAGRDITALRRAQAASQESERRFRLLFHHAPIPYQSLDPHGNILDVNDTWLQVLGYERHEVMGRPFRDFIAPAATALFHRSFEELRRQGTMRNIEVAMVKKNGATLIVALDGKAVADTQGALIHTLCVFRDITRQKELDAMLRNSRAILEKEVRQRTRELQDKGLEQEKTLVALEKKSQDLHDANIALKVLLAQGSKAESELENRVLGNIKEQVLPYLDALEMELTDHPGAAYVQILRQKLAQITSSFSRQLTSPLIGLTPRELQVTELIKQGRTNKDIAALLHISAGTVDVYRNNIRKKLGLKNKKVNLQAHLLTSF
jgi:PAS domain S-box-containing protein